MYSEISKSLNTGYYYGSLKLCPKGVCYLEMSVEEDFTVNGPNYVFFFSLPTVPTHYPQ